MNKLYIFLVSLFAYQFAFAQENNVVEMADKFRADGKIYVVVTVLAVILSGIFFYLFRLEQKIKKLE